MNPSETTPPNPTSDLDLLRSFLACESLPHNWYDSYGVRKARSDALTRRSSRKAGFSADSFINPNSETALTLFVLGNTDSWRQVNAHRNSPRVAGTDWNYKFFTDLLTGGIGEREAGSSLWSHHAGEGALFGQDAVDWHNLVLLFEFEVAGKAFHQRKAKEDKFTDLSFLKVDDLKKWSKFDAVLIDPTHQCFYFIEAKLRSDSSAGTKKYPHVNQIVRSLEAAFWLTTHRDSKYRDWQFRYAFLSPRLIHDYKLRYYAFALNSVDRMLSDYQRLLWEVYRSNLRLDAASFSEQFEVFRVKALDAVRVIHWDAFGKVLADHRPEVSDGYFDDIRESHSQARPQGDVEKVIQNIKKRHKFAGVDSGT